MGRNLPSPKASTGEIPKELFWVEGATHMDLYDKEPYVPSAVEKMSRFFKENFGTGAKDVAHPVEAA